MELVLFKLKQKIKKSFLFNKIFFFLVIYNFIKISKFNGHIKKNNFKNFKLNHSHINNHPEGMVINKYILILEIKDTLYNSKFLKSNFNLKNNLDIFFQKILNFENNHLELNKIFLNQLKLLRKKYDFLSFVIYLIYFGNFKINSIILEREINNKDKVANFLYYSFVLKNLTVSNLNQKEKLFITKKYFRENYNNYYALKTLELSTEHFLSNKKILFLIKKRVSKIKKKDDLTNKIYGESLYAFGHLINFIEILHRQKKLKILGNKKIIISPFFIANSYLALYLKEKFKKKVEINHNKFLKLLIDNKMDKSINSEEIDNNNSIYNLSLAEFKKKKIISSSLDKNILKIIDKKYNLKPYRPKNKFALFNLREISFKKYDKYISTNLDRYSNLEYVNLLIKKIIDYGYTVIILNGGKNIKVKNKKFFNYSQSKIKNDYNDINLIKNCHFLVNLGQTATTCMPLLFRKYSLNIDYPMNRKPVFDDRSYFIEKKFTLGKKKLNIKDYLNNDLYINHDFEILKQKGYVINKMKYEDIENKLTKFMKIIEKKKKIKVRNLGFKYQINIL